MHLQLLKTRYVEPASMAEPRAPVGSLEHALLFQLSQIFANRYLAYFEQYSQLLDFDVSFVFEELQNSSSPCFRCHKPIRNGRSASALYHLICKQCSPLEGLGRWRQSWRGAACSSSALQATPLQCAPRGVASGPPSNCRALRRHHHLGSTFHRNLDWITVPIFSYPVIMGVINRIDLSDIARQEIQVVGIRTWGFGDRMIT